MSLSKYYKNTTSFQPEELIKREEESPSGWQSQAPQEQLPFQTQQLATASAPAPQDDTPAPAATPKPLPPDNVNTPDTETGKTEKTVAPGQKPIVLPIEPVIDLSNYLELTVAEKKIEEAYQKGIQAGKDKVEQDFVDATRALLSTCQQLDSVRETIIGNSYQELQEFALSIAERILRISVREQDSTIIATIEEALQRAVKSDEFTIFIHPEDYETVAENSAEIVAGLTGLNKIVIKKDITVERGGTKIESDNCTIDATIASQLDVIREEIKKNL
jgi:flagellar assembly protein FliH